MRVWSKREAGIPPNAVYVGRPTKWGNPFKIGGQAGSDASWTRERVIELYRSWLLKDAPELIEQAKRELRGKDLVCWCAPLPCHADVLMELANQEDEALPTLHLGQRTKISSKETLMTPATTRYDSELAEIAACLDVAHEYLDVAEEDGDHHGERLARAEIAALAEERQQMKDSPQ